MTGLRAGGSIRDWAEAQRRTQQMQYEPEPPAPVPAVLGDRREQATERQHHEGEARRRSARLDAEVDALQGLLVAGCRTPAFRMSTLIRPERPEPFDPGHLAHPVPMPRIEQFEQQSAGWTLGSGQRAQAERDAHARYTRAWQAAHSAEAQRQQQLASYRQQYDVWAADQIAGIRAHNGGLDELGRQLRAGDPEAVVEYFSAALFASTAWPEALPRQVAAAYDGAARQLVLDWELPGYAVVPEARSVQYLPSTGQYRVKPRPATERRGLYRDVLAQCLLLVVREVYAADEFSVVDSVVVNGLVESHDPVTGQDAQFVLATVQAGRSAFSGLRLEQVSAVDCLVEGLRGQLSARPDQLTAVRPGRRPEEVGTVVGHGGHAEEPDLFSMDPIAFENLVAELFRAMGMEAVTTQRSGDGGVDVEALDPTPIRGGRIVVQVKRYRNTVPPTAVRDLYGTVQDRGANKGVLVTTAGFGPTSYAFIEDKPLELVDGAVLVDLLHQHGLRGRLGGGPTAAPVPAQRTAGPPLPAEYNVLGMSWAGPVALDVCALVCEGGRVLSEDHFVFFNNPGSPEGSVRTHPHSAPDKAALLVAFEELPQQADRLVIVAAVDPEANPDADLAGFTDARIRLLDTRDGELGQLEVSDGRAGETALVLGSFRRRPGGDWDFVIGGKGYPGGLAPLLGDFGVEVS
ncbi:restriction endonuclease [Streptomyces sp. NPDC051546]|uniref:restriction endonuclease n=1 Tax=Streptomyces sp. NPDC051546 TaxID=3365655 RepID=UPI00378C2817